MHIALPPRSPTTILDFAVGERLIFFIVAHVSGCISVSYKYMQQRCAVRQVGSAWVLVMQLNSELMDELDLSKCF